MFKGQGINRSAKGSADKSGFISGGLRRISEEEMNTAAVKKYRINKGQMIGSILLIIVLVSLSAITISSAMGGAISHLTNQSENYQIIEVAYGDTIWDLADKYCDKTKTDIRTSVKEIYVLNNIEDEVIYPGQTIRIPV